MIKRPTWIVLAVFIIALAAVLILQKTRKLEPSVEGTPVPTAVSVFGLDTGSITSVKIEKSGGDVAEFSRDASGAWTATAPASLQADASTIGDALGQVSTWTIQTELQVAPPLDAIGLNSPSYLLTFGMDSGQQHVIQVGSLNPAQTGYYLQLDGGAPFLVSRYSVDPVLGLLNLLHITPTPPAAETMNAEVTTAP